MRLALCNEVVRALRFAAQCDLAAALGYDGIELAPFTVSEEPERLTSADLVTLRRAALLANWARARQHETLDRIPGPDDHDDDQGAEG